MVGANGPINADTFSGRIDVDLAPIDGGRLRVRVKDNGPGIAPQEQAQLFEKFHRAGAAAGGSDLGVHVGDTYLGGDPRGGAVGH